LFNEPYDIIHTPQGDLESTLRGWATGNTNLTRGNDEELSAFKLLSVFLKHPVQLVNLGLKCRSRKAKENDAGVGESLVEDQLPEIPISNNKNSLLLPGEC